MAIRWRANRAGGAEQRRRFILQLIFRGILVSALLGSTIFFNLKRGVSFGALTQLGLYGVVVAVYLMTAAYAVWLRFGRGKLDPHVQFQIVFDVLVATVLVYITGGVESPFTFFYALPIVNSAMFFPRRVTMLAAGMACLLLGALYVLENRGVLPVDLEGRAGTPPPMAKVVYLLSFNFAALGATAWLAGYLGEQLRRTHVELREIELDLEAMLALNRDIVRSLRSGLMALDVDGRVSLLNPVAEDIIGCTQNDAIGHPGENVFPSLAMVDLVDRASKPRTFPRLEVEHQRAESARPVPVGLTLSPLNHPDGSAAGTLIHMLDLTEVKDMQSSMKRSERLAAVGKMAAAIAHEIRNPLTAISGSVQMLQPPDGQDSPDRRLMDIIMRETNRLDQLLKDFLAYARPKEPRLASCDLGALCEEVLDVFRLGEGMGDLRLTSDLLQLTAVVDSDQIRQVFWNLLSNAADASGPRGHIRVALRQDTDRVVLEVTDDGPGASPHVREHMFDPFFTTKEKGTGLGLATVGQIVEAHGGSIRVDCPAEGGCRFSVRLAALKRTS